jgi:hypothetical protein
VKARVDSIVMREELIQEELKKFHKPMADQLKTHYRSIVDTTNTNKRFLLPSDDTLPVLMAIPSQSTTLIPIEHTSKESSKSKKVFKEC